MQPDIARRFDTEFAPRIARTIAGVLGGGVVTTALPYGGHGHPSRVRIASADSAHVHRYAHPLNVELTWDIDEIEQLMTSEGHARFTRYLAALPRKLPAWEDAREIDFGSRTQAEPLILLGGLDFEA